MPRVVFYQRDGAKQLDEWMALHLRDDDVVFEKDIHSLKGNRKTYEDYLTERDCYEIDASALRLSEDWYKNDSGKDRYLYLNISLGQMVEYKLMKYFVTLFKDIALLIKLKEKEKPGSFVFVEDGSAFSGLLKEFSRTCGIGMEAVASLAVAESSENGRKFKECIKSLAWNLLVFFQKFRPKKTRTEKIILVEGYGKFIPLIKKLAGEGKRVILIGRLGFGKGLFHPNIFYYPWSRFIPLKISLKEELPCPEAGLLKEQAEPGFKSFDARKLIMKQLEDIIHSDFPYIRASIFKIKKFLIRQKVNTIITLQDRNGINRILVSCGNSLGINTIEVQHGTLSNLPYLVSPISQKIFIWGKASKEFYLKRNIEDERIYIVGEPNLEALKLADSSRIAALKKILGLSSDRPVILFASQPFIEITSLDSPLKTLDLFECICETAHRLREVDFLIKFHPNENSKIKEEVLRKYEHSNVFIAGKGLTNELLSLSHVLITFSSSIVLEACLIGIPVITVNLTGKKDFLPIVEMGGALGVSREKDLAPAVKSALDDGKIKNSLIEGQKKFIVSQIDRGEESLKRMTVLI